MTSSEPTDSEYNSIGIIPLKEKSEFPTQAKLEFERDVYFENRFIITLPLSKQGEGKNPGIDSWRNLSKENFENKWKEAFNISNIGMLCGEINGLVAFDVDLKDRGVDVFEKLLQKYGPLPNCPIQRTPKFGFHYIFKFTENIRHITSSSKKVAFINEPNTKLGFDFKSNGSYIVVEPSVNRITKRPYKWEPRKSINDFIENGIEIPEMPDWIVRLLTIGLIDENYNILEERPKKVFQHLEEENSEIKSSATSRFTYTSRENAEEYFIELLELLPSAIWQPYDDWLQLGMIIFNFYEHKKGKAFKIWDKYSEKNSGESYDPEEIDTKLDSFKTESGEKQLGITKLRELCIQTNSEKFNKIQEKYGFIKKPGFGFQFDMTTKAHFGEWFKFTLEVQESIDDFILWVNSCIIFVSNGGKTYYITKNFDKNNVIQFDFVPGIRIPKAKTIEWKNPEYEPEEAEKARNEGRRYDIPETFTKPIVSLIEKYFWLVYDYSAFRPYFGNPPIFKNKTFNLFGGFRAKVNPELEINMELILPILNHILYIWCSGIETNYEYILNWFTKIFQDPAAKTKVAILLKSKDQQAGKQFILNFIGEFIIGNQYFTTVKNVEQVCGKFNKAIQNKILTVLDEVCWGGDIKVNNGLKNLITQPTQQLEMKGVDPIEVEDFNNLVFCSNEDWALKIEKGDNRIFALEVDCSRCRDHEYFKKVAKSFTEETAEHLYNYLLRRNISNFRPQNIPQTKLRSELAFTSASPFDKFLVDCRDGYVPELKKDTKIQLKTLAEIFSDWCKSHSIKNSKTTKQVELEFGKLGLEKTRSKNLRFLVWDLEKVKKYVSKFCHDDFSEIPETDEPMEESEDEF